jgi:hypothetical protein
MVNPVPNVPAEQWRPQSLGTQPASPDIILFDDDGVPIELMTDLIFENIGGQELINIARNDLINGQNIIYSPIKNLNLLAQQYNSKNILSLSNSADAYFKNFSIKFENKLPNVGTGPNGEIVYLDENGNLVVNTINLLRDEQIEIQIITSGEIFDDTIYDEEL